MKKVSALLSFLCIAAILFSACTSSGTPVSSGATAEGNTSAAGTGGKLTVYSPQGDAERGPWIAERCLQDTGIEVEFLTAGGADIAERLRAEKSNPQADVVMGLVQTAMYQLKNEDLLAPYTPSWAEGLPEVYKDADGYFCSFWQTPIVIGYNPEFVSAPPESWLDLIKPEFNGMYAVGSTAGQTARVYIMGMLWNYYDEATGDITEEGWEMLRQFYQNAYTLPADADSFLLMKDGTLPIALWWFGGAESKAELNEIDIQYVMPTEGTPIVAEAVAVVKGTDDEALAQQFIDWWGSPEIMAAYAEEFGQAPAHPDAIALCPEEVKADAEMFTAQDIDWEICAEKMDGWFEKIELEIMP